MADAKRDNNFVTTLLAVSSVDGVTPVTLYANPTTHRLLVDLAGGGSGTVQTISIATANGFAGTSDGDPNNPTLTLATSITGILKGNGTAISAITVGSGLSYDGTTLSATGGGSGTVTSVDMTVPTGLSVSGNPVTTSGTLALTLTAGYVIPTSASLATYVVGPASATDNALARYDSTTGKLIQDGTVSASDVTGGAVTVASIGNNDLVLATGNATTGNITITDGANGDIVAAPNGSGSFNVQSSGTTSELYVVNGSSYIGGFATTGGEANTYAIAADGSSFDGYALAGSSRLRITDTGAGATGPYLELYHNSASPAANDVVGSVQYYGEDSAGNKQEYARIQGVISDTTSTSEDGYLRFWVTAAGAITSKVDLTNTAFVPTADNGLNLGGSGAAFNATHTTTIELGAASDTTISRSSAGVIAVEGVVIPSISSTNTLTNKRVTPRVGTTTSSATPTINTDNVDYYSLTAQTADITSFTTNLSGTPTDGQKLWISITGTAARAITWGSSFEASTVALPTTTVTTNRLDVGFVWNVATSKWRCVASC